MTPTNAPDREPGVIQHLPEYCWNQTLTQDARLEFHMTQAIWVDRVLLAQLLENRIRNAIEHAEIATDRSLALLHRPPK